MVSLALFVSISGKSASSKRGSALLLAVTDRLCESESSESDPSEPSSELLSMTARGLRGIDEETLEAKPFPKASSSVCSPTSSRFDSLAFLGSSDERGFDLGSNDFLPMTEEAF